ncbi:MAG: HD domain-containing protein [Candidatus Omnitrophica bacterium]|nr:HD domain-containing protein [Candidatus Omnitrophota bacterium]MDD5311165.1 HD domain-containing protein [Candidatus Omnitrophota bacterium]MDD5547191.1 HD domain-containing protein [Candidatus Omnitrophota bacterium]
MDINTTRTINELVSAIAYVLDVMSEGTNLYHSWRVGIFASQFAKATVPDERKTIFYASLLHDIGYLALPEHITHYLFAQEDPTKDPIILSHPIIGAELTSQIPNLSTIAKLILNHHERYNGRGYPLGKQRNEIPLGAQIILLSDQLDMLMRNESVRGIKAIEKEISSWSNERVSAELVETAIRVLRDEGLIEEVSAKEKIPAVFNRVREETGPVDIPGSVDAVGIACEVFSQLIDTKHPSMIGHSKRVSVYSMLISLAMNLSHDEITKTKWAALLHDVGKLGIAKSLISKPGKLTPQEFATMKIHAVFTRELLETITDFKDIALIASSDHERYDGKGYPMGIKGDQIPLGTRIISVADAFDAMTSTRTYRKALGKDSACDEIEKCAGTQFDPAVVKEAIPVLRNLSISLM